MKTEQFSTQMAEDVALVERALRSAFLNSERYADLQQAMEYSLLLSGKRIRPILVLETCRMCGGDVELAVPFACAIEMIHTYSLIHDDLPAMDDDSLRRGRPTNHIVHGEATAILAGDALLTAAFEMLTTAELSPSQIVDGVRCLSQSAGHGGMIAGQVLDMAGEGRALAVGQLEILQTLKTGALIAAACELGCIVAGGTMEHRAVMRRYGHAIGRAFQVRDDILDVVSTEESIGKPIGSDRKSEKSTFMTALGLEGCNALVIQLTDEAEQIIEVFAHGEFHRWLARRLADRMS